MSEKQLQQKTNEAMETSDEDDSLKDSELEEDTDIKLHPQISDENFNFPVCV